MKQEKELTFEDFVEKESYEKGFSSHFKAKIAPVLGEIEKNRFVQKAEYVKRKAIAVPVIVVVMVLGFVLAGALISATDDAGNIVFLAAAICGGIWMTWVRAPLRKYKTDVKSKFLPVICEFFGDLKYSVGGWTDRNDLLKLEIFPKFTRINTEDFISGKYKGFSIHMNEMTLKRKQGKNTVTVFKGLVVVIGFPKPFNGKTVLRRDVGKFGNWFSKLGNGLDRVELEDPDFESIFEVYSSDQVEARYLLTTAFMERLISLARIRGGGKAKPSVQCEFFRNELVIMIPSQQNLFEPASINKSALDHEDIHTFLRQMHELFELIDVLKLDRV